MKLHSRWECAMARDLDWARWRTNRAIRLQLLLITSHRGVITWYTFLIIIARPPSFLTPLMYYFSDMNPPAHPCIDDLLSLINQAHIQQELSSSANRGIKCAEDPSVGI